MTVCSAPGKVILFGEHAVVYGEPALAIAVNKRIKVTGMGSSEFLLNGKPLGLEAKPYVRTALERVWKGEPLSLTTESELPSASGMGSSASVTVATLGLLTGLQDEFSRELIGKTGFEVEYSVQGRASPIDTSTVSHGSAVFADRNEGAGFLYSVQKNDVTWSLHSLDIPKMKIVVGDTGIKGATGELVEKVRSYVSTSDQGRSIVKRIGELTLEGVEAIRDEDFAKMGDLMVKNHQLLNQLGVDHTLLDRFVDAVLPLSYGAKLTGAGGGGSMIALTDNPEEVAARIVELGGKSYIVETEKEGVRLHGD